MKPTSFRIALGVLLVLFGTRVGEGAIIVVHPGPGTPVQDAIDAAQPGDTVRLSGGGYPEAVVITKPLKLVGVPGSVNDNQPQAAVIGAGCDPGTTGITVAADDVKIQHLRVITFTEYGIDIQGRNRVRVKDVMALPHCPDLPIATFNVVGGTHVQIDKSKASAQLVLPPTGIRLSGLAAGANIRLRRTSAARHDVGILIENCAPGSVRVANSYANYNVAAGILLQNSDGIEIKKNQVAQNTDAGIVLDAGSDDNRIIRNDVSESAVDVSDAGTGNCWHDNSYTTGTVPPCL